jgi:hypothetical protein
LENILLLLYWIHFLCLSLILFPWFIELVFNSASEVLFVLSILLYVYFYYCLNFEFTYLVF